MLEAGYGGITVSQFQHFRGLQGEVRSFSSLFVSLGRVGDRKQQIGTTLQADRIIPEERRRQQIDGDGVVLASYFEGLLVEPECEALCDSSSDVHADG